MSTSTFRAVEVQVRPQVGREPLHHDEQWSTPCAPAPLVIAQERKGPAKTATASRCATQAPLSQ
jgi:hypothetical protein